MYEKMVRAVQVETLPDLEALLQQMRSKLPKVYTEKSVIAYCSTFDLVLKIGIRLGYTPMMLYLPARPNPTGNLVSQFQQINKTIATRGQNKEWFHDLFALFIALPSYLSLSWNEVEETILQINSQKKEPM